MSTANPPATPPTDPTPAPAAPPQQADPTVADLALTHATAAPDTHQLTSVGRLIGAALIDTVLSFVTLGIGWLIWAAITASEGQTPGKKLMGMQVVDKNTGRPLDWAQYVFLRGLIGGFVNGLASTFTLYVLFFMPLWDKANQGVHAKVSNSVVVDVR